MIIHFVSNNNVLSVNFMWTVEGLLCIAHLHSLCHKEETAILFTLMY